MPTERNAQGRFVRRAGQYLDSKGYWCYSAGADRGRRVHRVLVERRIGRRLRPDEHVHHVDGDKQNNADENLQVLGEREHNAVSSRQYWYLKQNVWPRERAEWEREYGSTK